MAICRREFLQLAGMGGVVLVTGMGRSAFAAHPAAGFNFLQLSDSHWGFPPRPPEDDRTRESFAAHTGLAFDPLGAVEASANLTASLLFEPSRASRLVEHHARQVSQPALEEVLSTILKATWQAPRETGLPGQTQFAVDDVVLRHLLALATSPEASGQARALARSAATSLEAWLGSQIAAHSDPSDLQAHFAAALATLERFHKDPEKFTLPPALPTPPGQPIGDDDQDVAIR